MEALLTAIGNSELEAAQRCLEAGVDPCQLDESGKLPICEAAIKGDKEMVELLLEHGTDVNQADGPGQSALAGAAFRGHQDMVGLLLENGADVDATSSLGGTALYWASCGGHFEIIRHLVEAGCDVDKTTDDGQSPLGRAASGVYSPSALSIVCFLLEHGANVNHGDTAGRTPLMNCAFGGHLEIARCLLEAGADSNLRSKHNETAVNFVCQARDESPEVLKLLLDSGSDADAIDELYHIGALSQAAVKNHHRLVLELLQNGALVNGLPDETESPLCNAAHRGAVDSVRVLIEHDADVEFAGRNSDGCERGDQSPLIASLRRHHNEVAILLIEAGTGVNKIDSHGVTPLLIALGYHDSWEYERSQPPKVDLPLIQLLLEKGADPDRPSGGSALVLARQTKNTRLIGLIQKFST